MKYKKMVYSSYNTRCSIDSGHILAILWGFLAPQTDSGCSCPHQHAISIQVVSQIPQTNLGLHPNQTDGPNNQVSCPLGLDPEDVFHTTPNPGPSSISLGLSLRQLLMPASFALKTLPVVPFLQLLKFFFRTVRRVRPHIPTTVILIQKFLKDLTVMDRRWRYLIIPNQFMLDVYIDMILVAVVVLSVLLGPTSIDILLAFFLLAPILWSLPLFDPLVLLPTIALPGSLHNAGVHNLPFPSRESFLSKKGIKFLKQPLNQSGLCQLLPKQPDGLLIRHRIAEAQIQKPHERYSVPNLKFDLFVRKVVQRLKHKHLEHQNNVKGLSAGVGFAFFVPHGLQLRSKAFPVHQFLEFRQWIASCVQLLKTIIPIKKAGLHHGLSLYVGFNLHNLSALSLVES